MPTRFSTKPLVVRQTKPTSHKHVDDVDLIIKYSSIHPSSVRPIHLFVSYAPNHTKLFVQFKPWNWWGLCWEIDVGPSLLALLQTRHADECCLKWPVWSTHDAPITPNFPYGSNCEIDGDYVHIITTGDADGWCLNWPVINPSSPTLSNYEGW